MELHIAHLYPDALNLYGDRGNILSLRRRAEWRGITVSVTPIRVGEHALLTDFDLFFLGGGQDFEQTVLLRDLAAGRAKELRAAAADGKTFLGICGGYQMLGHSYTTHEGVQLSYLGLVDLETKAGEGRRIGDFAFETEDAGIVVGFENHSGLTTLSPGVPPLGRVIYGSGNNGSDATEGVHCGNLFGTYSHGPVLPKNPALCDLVLLSALRTKYGVSELDPLDDREETIAHDAALRRLSEQRR